MPVYGTIINSDKGWVRSLVFHFIGLPLDLAWGRAAATVSNDGCWPGMGCSCWMLDVGPEKGCWMLDVGQKRVGCWM